MYKISERYLRHHDILQIIYTVDIHITRGQNTFKIN